MTYPTQIPSNTNYNGAGGETLNAGNNDTIPLSGGGNNVTAGSDDVITLYGGGNSVSMQDYGSLTIYDARSEASGFSGTVNFGDTISVYTNDTISLNYTLSLGASDTVTVNFAPQISEHTHLIGSILGLVGIGGPNDTVTEAYSVNAAARDVITFSGAGELVSLTLGSGDTISTTGSNDTIVIGGTATTKSSVTVGATASGTVINGGLGTDTFTAGSGYDGGNHYVGSTQTDADGFKAIGTCANYANLADRVTVNVNSGTGQGYDANGNQLWTDTYTEVQQIKAGQLDGNILTGSDSFFCELKGSLGSTTYYGGAGGDRIIWSSAGKTGLLDGQGSDIAYGGSGADEFYWRNSPGGKGVSNLGETIFNFSISQGDDLNLSEFADAGFAGVTQAFNGADNNPSNWARVTLDANGQDSWVWFDRTGSGTFNQAAVVLKNDNLFSDFGVSDTGSSGSQLVVQDMVSSGHLVLASPH